MNAKAIGFLRKDLAGDARQDARTIRELADRVGYTLIEMLTPRSEIEPDTATWLLARVHGHHAAAVAIADERHIPEPMMDAVTAVCSVVTPIRIILGHVQYPEG
jgi:malate synthase